MSLNRSILITGTLMLAVGLGAGYWFAAQRDAAPSAASTDAREPLFYRNAMNPAVTSPVPAKDTMGMDYVPVYAEEAGAGSSPMGTVQLDPAVVQSIGVRTAIAERTTITRAVRAVARVDFDEQRMSRLHPKVEGWIEDLRVNKTGEEVKKDQILLTIYAPKLVSTQQEYLLALNNLQALKGSGIADIRRGAEELVVSSRERLRLLDVPEHQIRELETSRNIQETLHIHTPVAGTVIRIGSRDGQYVTPNTELYMIVDLSRVWVFAEIFEYELPWVKVGDEVEMTLSGIPGRTFTGELDYIYPYAESRTRSVKVRLAFDNPELLLKPEMFAEVVIKSDKQMDAIVIPSEAVVRSGQSDRVFVVRAPGKFEPTTVQLGFQSAGQVAVIEGLEEGAEVVVSAQFLLDSESSLREATQKMMQGPSAPPADPPAMEEGMEMETQNVPDAGHGLDEADGQRSHD